MSKSFQKQTNNQKDASDKMKLEESMNQNPSTRKVVNKFAGMAERIVMVVPVIIPGYKIRG